MAEQSKKINKLNNKKTTLRREKKNETVKQVDQCFVMYC